MLKTAALLQKTNADDQVTSTFAHTQKNIQEMAIIVTSL